MKTSIPLLLGFLGLSGILRGQTIVGASLGGPAVFLGFSAAPGQVVTIYVEGLQGKEAVATATPLPTTLAGVTVFVKQGATQIPAALFSIRPVLDDSARPPKPTKWTAISLQIPFEALPPSFNLGSEIFVSGGESLTFSLVPAKIHVLLSAWPDFVSGLVFHADGKQVSSLNPARPGELLVTYAFGLGRTSPLVKTGEAAPADPLATSQVTLSFDFRPNARPAPISRLIQSGERPLFAGLAPGFVGLYQVNFKVPSELPAGLPSCTDGLSGPIGDAFVDIRSNLTVTIQGVGSFDGAGICVQP